jgi:hypothetical protein
MRRNHQYRIDYDEAMNLRKCFEKELINQGRNPGDVVM